jgi:hypothetical protein
MQLSGTAVLRTAASGDGSRPISAASSHDRPTTPEEEAQSERERTNTIQQLAVARTHQQTPNRPAPTCRHKCEEKTTMSKTVLLPIRRNQPWHAPIICRSKSTSRPTESPTSTNRHRQTDGPTDRVDASERPNSRDYRVQRDGMEWHSY